MTAKKKKAIKAAAVLLGLLAWNIWGNTAPEQNTYTVESHRLPAAFDGYRIAQISDLHNARMGENNEKLLLLLREAQPDIIAITGDMIDSRRTDVEVALAFAREAIKIAPCYYVTGNHEARLAAYSQLKAGMEAMGVVILENAKTRISLGGETVTVMGVNDPSYETDYLFGDADAVMQRTLTGLQEDTDGFTVLLSHRPELFDAYASKHMDLVLSGHAHGGQFRLPLIGGLVAPNQGLFPKYDGGCYTEGNTHMIVSRGIGNSIIPLRIFNRPEVVVIQLKRK